VIEAFRAELSEDQQDRFARYVVPFLCSGEQLFGEEHRFDLHLLQRYILPRVFALGWTAELFGEFDREIRDLGRESHKAERIGKKYQWIAYHEVLARIADNYVFKGRSWEEQAVPYEGPWQAGMRDIDPSMILRESRREGRRSKAPCWWAPLYQDWYGVRSNTDWLRTDDDLPKLAAYLTVNDPVDGSRWLTLEAHYAWEEPTPPDKEWSELSHRTVWYQLRAYVVRKEDADQFFSWARQQNYWGRWMPESGDFHDVFLGELYWSPAYRERFADSRGKRAKTRGDRPPKLPNDVIVPTMEYCGVGTGFDCSMEEPVHLYVPAPWLAEHLQLHWAGVEGEFCGPDGQVVARDPSVTTPGPSALLVRESALQEFLKTAGYEVVWTVLGSKQVVGEFPAVPDELQLSGAFVCPEGKAEGSVTGTYCAYGVQDN
jgi:hypothetical protein